MPNEACKGEKGSCARSYRCRSTGFCKTRAIRRTERRSAPKTPPNDNLSPAQLRSRLRRTYVHVAIAAVPATISARPAAERGVSRSLNTIQANAMETSSESLSI